MWTTTGHLSKFQRGRRGVSNVIVMVLSLVILVIVTSNVILWSYEMNQLDYEKMKEDVTITDAVGLTDSSSWFVAQSEYTLESGSHVNGSYTDTHTDDGSYETFNEASTGSGGILDSNSTRMLKDITAESGADSSASDYEDILTLMTDGNLSLGKEIFNYAADGSDYAHWCKINVEASNYGKVEVRVYFSSLEVTPYDWRVYVYQSDGNNIDTACYVDGSSTAIGWTTIDVTSIIHQLDEADFIKVRLVSLVGGGNEGKKAYISEMEWSLTTGYSLDLNGTFVIDVSTYPQFNIQTVEIQLRYMVNATSEKWYLKVYNWTDTTYGDSGFNSTAGHTPTSGWDYYTVNVTNQWSSYVHDNGTMYVKVVDEGGDSNQTNVDIDFLGVSVVSKRTKFTFQNQGSLTCHLVSLWVNNSTHHKRYDINVFINSGDTEAYIRSDIVLPNKPYTVKVITERGDTAVFSVS